MNKTLSFIPVILLSLFFLFGGTKAVAQEKATNSKVVGYTYQFTVQGTAGLFNGTSPNYTGQINPKSNLLPIAAYKLENLLIGDIVFSSNGGIYEILAIPTEGSIPTVAVKILNDPLGLGLDVPPSGDLSIARPTDRCGLITGYVADGGGNGGISFPLGTLIEAYNKMATDACINELAINPIDSFWRVPFVADNDSIIGIKDYWRYHDGDIDSSFVEWSLFGGGINNGSYSFSGNKIFGDSLCLADANGNKIAGSCLLLSEIGSDYSLSIEDQLFFGEKRKIYGTGIDFWAFDTLLLGGTKQIRLSNTDSPGGEILLQPGSQLIKEGYFLKAIDENGKILWDSIKVENISGLSQYVQNQIDIENEANRTKISHGAAPSSDGGSTPTMSYFEDTDWVSTVKGIDGTVGAGHSGISYVEIDTTNLSLGRSVTIKYFTEEEGLDLVLLSSQLGFLDASLVNADSIILKDGESIKLIRDEDYWIVAHKTGVQDTRKVSAIEIGSDSMNICATELGSVTVVDMRGAGNERSNYFFDGVKIASEYAGLQGVARSIGGLGSNVSNTTNPVLLPIGERKYLRAKVKFHSSSTLSPQELDTMDVISQGISDNIHAFYPDSNFVYMILDAPLAFDIGGGLASDDSRISVEYADVIEPAKVNMNSAVLKLDNTPTLSEAPTHYLAKDENDVVSEFPIQNIPQNNLQNSDNNNIRLSSSEGDSLDNYKLENLLITGQVGTDEAATFAGDVNTGEVRPTSLYFNNLDPYTTGTTGYDPRSTGEYRLKFGNNIDLDFQSEGAKNILHLTNGGRVGIGTRTPSDKLVVMDTVNNSQLIVQSKGATRYGGLLARNDINYQVGMFSFGTTATGTFFDENRRRNQLISSTFTLGITSGNGRPLVLGIGSGTGEGLRINPAADTEIKNSISIGNTTEYPASTKFAVFDATTGKVVGYRTFDPSSASSGASIFTTGGTAAGNLSFPTGTTITAQSPATPDEVATREYVDNKTSVTDYLTRDNYTTTIVVAKDGTGDFSDLQAASNAASSLNPSYANQIRILIKPGVYELTSTLDIPTFVKLEGRTTSSVTIQNSTSFLPINSYLFDIKRSGKISNVTVKNIGGTSYAIHVDNNNMEGEEQLYENVHFVQFNTSQSPILGGGVYEGSHVKFVNCTFSGNSPDNVVAIHDKQNVSNNAIFEFVGCTFSCYISLGNVGGFGSPIARFIGCNIQYPIQHWYTRELIQNSTDLDHWKAFANNWIIEGYGNKNLSYKSNSPNFGEGEHLIIETSNFGEDIEISGDTENLFGSYQTVKGSSRIRGRVESYGDVRDVKTGSADNDVIQFWSRLGDCSVNNKVLSVTVGGVTESYTFNQDYTTTQPSETTIIADVNAVLTIAQLSKKNAHSYNYENVYTDERKEVVVGSADVLEGEYVYVSRTDGKAYLLPDNADKNSYEEIGFVTEDAAAGEIVTIWTGNISYESTISNGLHGVTNSELDAAQTNKIVNAINNVLYRDFR